MDAGSGVEPPPPWKTTGQSSKPKTANYTVNGFLAEAYQTGETIDKKYGVPARQKIVTMGHVYPFTTALGLVFVGLSLVPILTFLGFSLFILLSFVLTALTTALVCAGAIILGAGAILFGVISLTFGCALFITVSGFIAYITYRLFFHVRDPNGRGVGAWQEETMMRLAPVDVTRLRDALASSKSKPVANGKPAFQ